MNGGNNDRPQIIGACLKEAVFLILAQNTLAVGAAFFFEPDLADGDTLDR
jgi:hypothetical protein